MISIIPVFSVSASEKFDRVSVDCEQFFQYKRTPVVTFDIPPDHRDDYKRDNGADYWAEPAAHFKEYCDRLPNQPLQKPGGPWRHIVGVWFQSNDGAFKMLWNTDDNKLDYRVIVKNDIAAVERRRLQHEQDLKNLAEQDTRQQEIQASQNKAQLDAIAAQARQREAVLAAEARARADFEIAKSAAEQVRFDKEHKFLNDENRLQERKFASNERVEFVVTPQMVAVNPFRYQDKVIAFRASFSKMVAKNTAQFGSALNPVILEGVTSRVDRRTGMPEDRFIRPNQDVFIAFRFKKMIGPTELQHSSWETGLEFLAIEFVKSVQQPTLIGEFVGSYDCKTPSCDDLYDDGV